MWWLAPTIMAGSQLAGQSASNIQNRQMADVAWARNVGMWNMQNEYNHPKAQMERLKEAGLNPRLMYGKGTAGAGQATQLPKYQAPKIDWSMNIPNVLGSLNQFTDIKVKNAQIDLVEEQRRLAAAHAQYYEDISDPRYDKFISDTRRAGRMSEQEWMKTAKMIIENGGINFDLDSKFGKRWTAEMMERVRGSRGMQTRFRELDKTSWDAMRSEMDAKVRQKDLEYYFWNFLGRSMSKVGFGAIRKVKPKGMKGRFVPRKTTRIPSTRQLKMSGGGTVNDWYNAARAAGARW